MQSQRTVALRRPTSTSYLGLGSLPNELLRVAPVGLDLGALTDVLTLEGVGRVDARSVAPGASLIESIRTAIDSSDLVVIVLSEREPDPPTFMVEVGLH